MEPIQTRSALIRANALCMAAMLSWATAFPCAEILLSIMPPLPLTSLRFGLAATILLLLWVAVEGYSALKIAPWLRGMAIGGIGFGTGSIMLIYAQALSDPVTVAVISAAMPVIVMVLEVVFDRRNR